MAATAAPLRIAAFLAFLTTTTFAQSGPRMERIWGGETRQIFTLKDSHDDVHVWTAGDGARIRHAVNPGGVSTTWTTQTLPEPEDDTQNVLDVHFIPNHEPTVPEHYGFACGFNGNVFTTDDYGANWTRLGGHVQNSLTPAEDAFLWRNRFLNPDDGFVCGLWTFKRWDGSAWNDLDLRDENNQQFSANRFEFYALELLVDPSDPEQWTGVAAGQQWGDPGGGHAQTAVVFYTNSTSEFDFGNRWKIVFRDLSDPNDPDPLDLDNPENWNFDDPWDVEFDPTTGTPEDRVGYLSVGIGTKHGAVYRTDDGGQNWDPVPEFVAEIAALYGITVLDADTAVAVGYGGEIWVRQPNGLWQRRRGNPPLPAGITETHTGPLAGAHCQDGDVFVTGSWGYCRMSTNAFATNSINLEPLSSSEGSVEQWRISDIDFTTADRGYGVSANTNKMILETTNGGNDWDLSASSPGNLPLTGPVLHGLSAIDFRTGGGSGVAVGTGDIEFLDDEEEPSVEQAFAFFMHETENSTWEAGRFAEDFNPPEDWLMLGDVAWARGDGDSAEFWAIGLYVDDSLGNRPALLCSLDGGATWEDGEDLANYALSSSARLSAIAFQSSTNRGFIVGNTTSGVGVAYRLTLTGGAPILSSVPLSGGTDPLNDVTANSSFVIAVGDNESIYRYYHGQTGVFSTLTGLPTVFPTANKTDYMAVSAPPGADARLLVGMQPVQPAEIPVYEEAEAHALGKLLYYDAVGGWRTIPAGTNKRISALVLLTSGGFGSAGGIGHTEVGVVGDHAILRFVED